jgi:hypothetical protein
LFESLCWFLQILAPEATLSSGTVRTECGQYASFKTMKMRRILASLRQRRIFFFCGIVSLLTAAASSYRCSTLPPFTAYKTAPLVTVERCEVKGIGVANALIPAFLSGVHAASLESHGHPSTATKTVLFSLSDIL